LKEKGNNTYKEGNLEEAVDIYIKALCGFQFNKKELNKS